MSDEIANWLIDEGVTICTSFDGPKQVHDKNRFILGKDGVEIGTYSQVVSWIKKINEIYKRKKISLNVNALMTITKHSLPYHKEILDEYIKLGVYLVNIRGLTEVGRVFDNKESISYSYDKFIEFYENSMKYIEELNKSGVPIVERIKQLFFTKIISNVPTYHTEYDSPCGAATGQITYFNDGNIYTCNEALGRDEFKIGNVFDDKNWQKIFKRREVSKAVLNSMLEQNVKCDRCVYKPYCSTCMVENYYKDKKFNFYPNKTLKHHETIYQSNKLFDDLLKNIKGKL
jgi:radical SAM protein with 4Fe4S-binding SPASM domain